MQSSFYYKIIIVLLSCSLIAILYLPGSFWDSEQVCTLQCRRHMQNIFFAEQLFYYANGAYTDSLQILLRAMTRDSSLKWLDDLLLKDTTSYDELVNFILLTEVTDKSGDAVDAFLSLRQTRHEYKNGNHNISLTDSIRHFRSLLIRDVQNSDRCPTVNNSYDIQCQSDDFTIKITCPIETRDIERIRNEFFRGYIGGLIIQNHGTIENNIANWQTSLY